MQTETPCRTSAAICVATRVRAEAAGVSGAGTAAMALRSGSVVNATRAPTLTVMVAVQYRAHLRAKSVLAREAYNNKFSHAPARIAVSNRAAESRDGFSRPADRLHRPQRQ